MLCGQVGFRYIGGYPAIGSAYISYNKTKLNHLIYANANNSV